MTPFGDMLASRYHRSVLSTPSTEEGTRMGFKDAALPLKEQALADRIVRGFEQALAEDRLIRAGAIPEPFTVTGKGVERA
jgi:hypothetical protein